MDYYEQVEGEPLGKLTSISATLRTITRLRTTRPGSSSWRLPLERDQRPVRSYAKPQILSPSKRAQALFRAEESGAKLWALKEKIDPLNLAILRANQETRIYIPIMEVKK